MKNDRFRLFRVDSDRNVGFNKKYTTIAFYAILVILFAAILVYLLLSPDRLDGLLGVIKSIFSPILIGLVIAYLLYPICRFFETRVFISALSRQWRKCRIALYRAKLRYDFECREHKEDSAVIESASRALTAARQALLEVNRTREMRNQKQSEKRVRRHSAPKHLSYAATSPKDASSPRRIGKTLSIVSAYLLFILLISLLIWVIIPPCIESISELLILSRSFITTLPKTITSYELGRQLRDLLREFGLADDVKNWVMGLSSKLLSSLAGILGELPAFFSALISNLTNLLLGVFFSVYFLSSREFLLGQLKKISRALFPKRVYGAGRHVLYEINRKFGKYIQGKLTSSAILGIFSFILFWAVGIPYFQMITLITTVTNLIPFFGPFIGAIPSAIIILITAPNKLIIFILLVLILQQIEGNILEPYILGDSLGLRPVWIMVAIVVMGELFGIPGMILGIPFFAAIYTLISEACDRRLKRKN